MKTILGGLTLGLVLATTVAGCGSTYMMSATQPTSLQPARGDATVVILRPSGFGRSAQTHVAADTVGYLGTLRGQERMVVKLAAGHHTFFSWAENTDVVRAELAPGKVYYLLLSVRMGVWNARHSLSRFASDRKEWTRFREWLATTKEVVRKPGDAGSGPSAAEVNAQKQKAVALWESYDTVKQGLRTLKPTDGREPASTQAPDATPDQPRLGR